jgi:L-asparagine transporter-like permease
MNFVVLTAALSGANAALYVSSRMLFSMARTGWAPATLGKLNSQGSPMPALLVSSYGIVVALVLIKWAPANAFEFILRGAFFGMILSWVVSLAAHAVFRKRSNSHQLQALPIHSPFGGWGSRLGFIVICAVIVKGWWDSRVNFVSAVLYLILLSAAWWLIQRTKREVHPHGASAQ